MSDTRPPATVEPQRPGEESSPIRSSEPTMSSVSSDVVICQWNGRAFTDGMRICAGGTVYECCGDEAGPYWRPTGESG